ARGRRQSRAGVLETPRIASYGYSPKKNSIRSSQLLHGVSPGSTGTAASPASHCASPARPVCRRA
ncbi:MAG: hypothetical protein M3P34_03680, partial [Actinomycetota bacterium]|nr:hypothetical protein [Actinomycetota bacterium]